MNEFEKFVCGLAEGQADLMRLGAEAGQDTERRKLRAVLIAYNHALADPQAKIPSALMAAIEALR